MALPDTKSVWLSILESLSADFSIDFYKCWFADLDLAYLSEDIAVLVGISDFKCNIIQEKYAAKLSDYFYDILNKRPRLVIVSREKSEPDIPAILRKCAADCSGGAAGDLPGQVPPSVSESEVFSGEEADGAQISDNYSFDYTFENFIVGDSNRFGHAACTAVANNPARAYNPLFIYGSSGPGKTHLMYAIKNEINKKFPNFKLVYIKGEDFTNQLIQSIAQTSMVEFRNRYRGCDVLLIDDIQFIAGKPSTQEEFFHTFNALYEDRRQIIMTSDRPPRDINVLEDRLKTRFEWGLIADIQPPDPELRVAIISNKAEQIGLELPAEVLNYLAENLQSNIRQIEGAVRKLSALTFLSGHTLSIELARSAVSELLGGKGSVNVTVDKIIGVISKKYGVTRDDLLSPRRTKHVTAARHVCIYLIRGATDMSLPSIGKFFMRDHSTVMSSIDVVDRRRAEDPIFDIEISELQRQIKV